MAPYGPQVPRTTASPAALTAGNTTRFTFSGAVLHLFIRNNSNTAIEGWAVNGIAQPGGWQIPANGGAVLWDQGGIATVDILSTAATAVNGSTTTNIVLRGWA